jgi:hypothetical protein
VDLRIPDARYEALHAYRTAFVAREATRLARQTPSVRRSPLAFAAGSAIVLAVPLALPLALVGGAAAFAAGTLVSAAGGYALGSAIRMASPHFLLGKAARLGIDREVREMAEQSLPVVVPAASPLAPGQVVTTAPLLGTPAPSPFGDEPVLAARLVGEVNGRKIDDAWFSPHEVFIEGASVERRQVLSLAWIEAPAAATLQRGMLSRAASQRLDAYLLERGLEVADDTSLTVTIVRAGDLARVRGTPVPRFVSDGYREQLEIADLTDAVIEATAPPMPMAARTASLEG